MPAVQTTPGRREGQTFGGESLAARYASFVKLPHTLFALPFAGVGAILASYEFPNGISTAAVLWIVLAFTSARFAAMGFNRIVDRGYDALNPRTKLRELPSGRITMRQAVIAVVVAAALFIYSAFQLNPLCGWLSPVALAWTFFYSYTKRFTALSHYVLGLSLGIAPAGAYLAVSAQWTEPAWALPLLSAAVLLWVAGFDIIYALQDLDFDREHKLNSVPARLGLRKSLLLSRAAHGVAVLLFALVFLLHAFPVRWMYATAVGIAAVLLHFGHAAVKVRNDQPIDIRAIDLAFFRTNVFVSTSFFVLTLLDRLILA